MNKGEVMSTIPVKSPLVVLHGDEMAQVAFDAILDRFVDPYLDIALEAIDLSAANRLLTNGAVVQDAIASLKRCGVGIKNAGMTLNAQQLDQWLAEHPDVDGTALHPLATRSPNGAIREGIAGNITREDIPFNNLALKAPSWQGRDIEVDTMDSGGILDSHNELSQATGILKLLFVGASGDPVELHRRRLNVGDPWLLATNDLREVETWAHAFFTSALDNDQDAYLGLKDTVIPGYDGVMRKHIERVYEDHYSQAFSDKSRTYFYELIDAQAARIIANPPESVRWGVPDNNTGRKLHKLVEELKEFGIAERRSQVAISRMSAGGGDQYGSYNAAASEDGILKVVVDGQECHARDIRAGDPILLMSNDRLAIQDWVTQVFRDASRKNKELYFGLKREYMAYDDVYSDIIASTRRVLASTGTPPPSFMIMRPSSQLKKMIADPPRSALYPAQNLDGDIFSDIAAALGGSLATASSSIESKEGTMLFEAPHGTAHDLYEIYLESKGETVSFNPSALLYALANALETLAQRESNDELANYARALKEALINTVDEGLITRDLMGKTTSPGSEEILDMPGFLEAVNERLDQLL